MPIKFWPAHVSFFLLGHPVAYGVPRTGIRSKPQLQTMPQLWQRQILNPLCWAGDLTCIPPLQRHGWSVMSQQELPAHIFKESGNRPVRVCVCVCACACVRCSQHSVIVNSPTGVRVSGSTPGPSATGHATSENDLLLSCLQYKMGIIIEFTQWNHMEIQ